SSSKGSPGASARTVNSTRLIPARTGIVMSRRRSRYLDMREERAGRPRAARPHATRLPFAVPVLQRPEVGVPAAPLRPQLGADRRHRGTLHHRDHYDVLDHQLVHLDEEGRPLDRIHLALGGAEHLVVLLAPPPRDVPALPLVVLARRLP